MGSSLAAGGVFFMTEFEKQYAEDIVNILLGDIYDILRILKYWFYFLLLSYISHTKWGINRGYPMLRIRYGFYPEKGYDIFPRERSDRGKISYQSEG